MFLVKVLGLVLIGLVWLLFVFELEKYNNLVLFGICVYVSE